MKFITLIFTIILITSCSCKKRTIESSSPVLAENKTVEPVNQQTGEPVIVNEIIVDTTKVVNPKSDNEIINDTVIPGNKVEEKNVFNHSLWTQLLSENVSEKGNVNYKGFKKDYALLKTYLSQLSQNPPASSWTEGEKLAYWINAYNAFTVKLIVDNYPIASIKEIDKPWDYRFARIGSKWYTLNDIEHTILRKMNEPRIHFAINCASVSCPKLLNTSFSPQNLETQLTKVTREFLSDPLRNEISTNRLKISKIFRWFAKDFKKDGSLIDFLNIYSEIPIQKDAKTSFKDYNWDLNE